MTLQIGQWIRRPGSMGGSKWHLCESIVAGDVVTRCGRRMRDSLPFQVSDVMPLTRAIGQPQLCKAGCDRPVTPADHGAFPEPADEGPIENDAAPL